MVQSASLDYEDRVLIYFDILGWSNLVRESLANPTAKRRLEETVSRLSRFPRAHQGLEDLDERAYKKEFDTYFTLFSDSVAVSCPAKYDFVMPLLDDVIALCTVLLVRSGLYVRGAVVRGPLSHERKARRGIIVGPALVDAVALEGKAEFPRMLVDESAQQVIEDSYLRTDPRDSRLFLDWLHHSGQNTWQIRKNAEHLRRKVEADLVGPHGATGSERLHVRQKHEWMNEYISAVVKELGEVDDDALSPGSMLS